MDQCAIHSGTAVNDMLGNGSTKMHKDGMIRHVLDVALLVPLESHGGSCYHSWLLSLLILSGV